MTLVPGPDLVVNYRDALVLGTISTNGEPVAAMMLNSLVMALAIAFGKIAISLPSVTCLGKATCGLIPDVVRPRPAFGCDAVSRWSWPSPTRVSSLNFARRVTFPSCADIIAALFVILFIYCWNQYLWPLLVTNTQR
jgi:sn-glycerol 3-phosphate transport system permease protein